jgi:hypothetical protein
MIDDRKRRILDYSDMRYSPTTIKESEGLRSSSTFKQHAKSSIGLPKWPYESKKAKLVPYDGTDTEKGDSGSSSEEIDTMKTVADRKKISFTIGKILMYQTILVISCSSVDNNQTFY